MKKSISTAVKRFGKHHEWAKHLRKDGKTEANRRIRRNSNKQQKEFAVFAGVAKRFTAADL